MRTSGLDGLDIDWEYPTAVGQPDQYLQLLTELRAELDAQAAGPKLIAALPLAQVQGQVDWINLMAYDFAGASSPITDFNAPLTPFEP